MTEKELQIIFDIPSAVVKNSKAAVNAICDGVLKVNGENIPMHDVSHVYNTFYNAIEISKLLKLEGAFNPDILFVASVCHDIGRQNGNGPAIDFAINSLNKHGATWVFINKTAETIRQHNSPEEPWLLEGWLLYLGDKLDLLNPERYQDALNLYREGVINKGVLSMAGREIREKLETVIERRGVLEKTFGVEAANHIYNLFSNRHANLMEIVNFEVARGTTYFSQQTKKDAEFWNEMNSIFSNTEFNVPQNNVPDITEL